MEPTPLATHSAKAYADQTPIPWTIRTLDDSARLFSYLFGLNNLTNQSAESYDALLIVVSHEFL